MPLAVPPLSATVSASRTGPPRTLGRFELRTLLGKSERTMVWLVAESVSGAERMLWLPRVQPTDADARDAWLAGVRAAARLRHPRLAAVLEVGVASHWPYLCVDRAVGVTLGEWLAGQPPTAPVDAVIALSQGLEALAYLHEAGAVHGDPQLHTLLVDPAGRLLLAAAEAGRDPTTVGTLRSAAMPVDPRALRAARDAAQRDVLAFGVLLHQLLAGAPALDLADTGRVIDQMPPRGRDAVRLPWDTPQPVPEALRVIADRAVLATERLRYLGARSLLRALDGWRTAHADEQGGALGLLIDRLRSVGHLPGMPGAMARVGLLAGSADAQRTDEIAEQVIDDMALSLELLRTVNSAQVQATQAPGNGSVLTIRRAIALVGIDGLRRAVNSLRVWPGPLDAAGARALADAMALARWAGRTAQALRPAGYDAEVVYLVTMLQNLGRLLVQYHFPDEAQQIHALMQPIPREPGSDDGAGPHPGLTEVAAAQAVLGCDIESIGAAVARHWGLGEEIQHMIRRLPLDRPARNPAGDDDMLRLVASAANEAVDAMHDTPQPRAAQALKPVAQRYGRALRIDLRTLRDALHAARTSARAAGTPSSPVPEAAPTANEAPDAAAGAAEQAAPAEPAARAA